MKKIVLTLSICALAAFGASAQSLQTAYFLDNNPFNFRLSPSLVGEKSFVSIALGDINPSVQSDLGINSLIFPDPSGTGLTTGLSPKISSDEFLGGLKDANSLAFGINMNLLSTGSWGRKCFNTFEVNLRGDVFASLPKDMFALLKSGAPRTYDMQYLHAGAQMWGEIAFGKAYPIFDGLTVGAKLKFLVGAANANINLNQADVTVTDETVGAAVDGDLRIAAQVLTMGTKVSEQTGNTILDVSSLGFSTQNLKPAGYGAAIDLGVTYTPMENLDVTFSLNDIGAIAWNYNIFGHSESSASITGLTEDVYIKETFSKMGEQLSDAADKLLSLAEFEQKSGQKSTEWLPWSLNLGGRYRMPFYDRLSAGLLFTHKQSKYIGFNDFRVGATITPVDWFSFSSNIGTSSFGPVCGMAAALNVIGINFTLGFDGWAGSVMNVPLEDLPIKSVNVPLNPFRANLKLGVAITFGKRNSPFKERVRTKEEAAE